MQKLVRLLAFGLLMFSAITIGAFFMFAGIVSFIDKDWTFFVMSCIMVSAMAVVMALSFDVYFNMD